MGLRVMGDSAKDSKEVVVEICAELASSVDISDGSVADG